ncbi:unnamed protein product [Brassica oleracea]
MLVQVRDRLPSSAKLLAPHAATRIWTHAYDPFEYREMIHLWVAPLTQEERVGVVFLSPMVSGGLFSRSSGTDSGIQRSP